MGDTQPVETHVKRSSGMSFALRWKHENLHLLNGAVAFAIAMVFLFFFLLSQTLVKQVGVVIDGERVTIETRKQDVAAFLEEQQIALGDYDRISTALHAPLKHGDQIVIDKAVPVELTADGKTETKYTVAKTVAAALREFDVDVGELDKVFPETDEAVVAGQPIQVVRVQKVVEEHTESIPFEVVKTDDPDLLKGKEQVVTEGKEGLLAKKVERVFEDGVLVAESIVSSAVREESVSKVVALGTKNPVVVLSASSPDIDEFTKGDVKFAYKKVLSNVTLTAYTADYASTGKTSEHPQYGVTASGTKVSEGRTVAVDPKVVPLGWWIYIEGIGLRRAEDTGGNVKGNWIDVYFDSADYAKKFGLKRGYKVYVIGKDKPEIN